jgi:hypothetical protein
VKAFFGSAVIALDESSSPSTKGSSVSLTRYCESLHLLHFVQNSNFATALRSVLLNRTSQFEHLIASLETHLRRDLTVSRVSAQLRSFNANKAAVVSLSRMVDTDIAYGARQLFLLNDLAFNAK